MHLKPHKYATTALAFHYDQLEASAFREEFNPDAFEDLTEPNVDLIHAVSDYLLFINELQLIDAQKAGKLLKEWKVELADDHSATLVIPVTGSKRKSVCIPIS